MMPAGVQSLLPCQRLPVLSPRFLCGHGVKTFSGTFGTAGGGIQESKLSVVGLDSVPLAAALPPTFLQRPAADFSVDEWEVRLGQAAGWWRCRHCRHGCSLLFAGHLHAPSPLLLVLPPQLPFACSTRCAAACCPPAVHLLPPAAPRLPQALYPLNYLISVGEARVVPAAEDPDGAAAPLPALRMHSRGPVPQAEAGRQVDRLDLELDTGKGGAWGVMNFTLAGGGSLLGWSLSDGVAQTEAPQVRPCVCVVVGCVGGALQAGMRLSPVRQRPRRMLPPCLLRPFHPAHLGLHAPLPVPFPCRGTQGGASHMVRFAGNLHARRYHFWLDVPAGEKLRVGLYVKFVEESAATRQLLADLPDWTSPAAVVSYHSRWQF